MWKQTIGNQLTNSNFWMNIKYTYDSFLQKNVFFLPYFHIYMYFICFVCGVPFVHRFFFGSQFLLFGLVPYFNFISLCCCVLGSSSRVQQYQTVCIKNIPSETTFDKHENHKFKRQKKSEEPPPKITLCYCASFKSKHTLTHLRMRFWWDNTLLYCIIFSNDNDTITISRTTFGDEPNEQKKMYKPR